MKKGERAKTFWLIGIVIAIVVFAAIGYYFVDENLMFSPKVSSSQLGPPQGSSALPLDRTPIQHVAKGCGREIEIPVSVSVSFPTDYGYSCEGNPEDLTDNDCCQGSEIGFAREMAQEACGNIPLPSIICPKDCPSLTQSNPGCSLSYEGGYVEAINYGGMNEIICAQNPGVVTAKKTMTYKCAPRLILVDY